jgi:2,4-dienoyl-CoA reductase-like NADH-dependent reductase (Old Yellow Enzyme family)
MSDAAPAFQRLGALKDVAAFRAYLRASEIDLPCDDSLVSGAGSPLLQPVSVDGLTIGNRICVHPMEGWDGTPDGRPTEATLRRWRRFGASGAKLIWGGEAVAVRRDGRANPNQLCIGRSSAGDLARLREALVEEHVRTTGSSDGLVIGLQLTHSGRYSQPNVKGRPEPRVACRHPILDKRVGVDSDGAVFSDAELRELVEDYTRAAKVAADAGFDFVDVKHCHGYLGHELLGAHTRPGDFGGSFENRTRFLREIVGGIRSVAPTLRVGVRLSAFDTVPFRPDPARSSPGKPGPGVPEPYQHLLPYRWGFGIAPDQPELSSLLETYDFLRMLPRFGIRLVNLTGGSPYYNPHIQRPAYYPPSDGYQPPEDPLKGVWRHLWMARELKGEAPDLVLVGTGYSYLQEFMPNVAQAALREGWVDCVGLGRVVLSYPEMFWDAAHGRPRQTKKICRTFSDCTTAPRNGLPSGCYPLDDYYKKSELHDRLKAAKAAKAAGGNKANGR